MVEHSPNILASEEKATTGTSSRPWGTSFVSLSRSRSPDRVKVSESPGGRVSMASNYGLCCFISFTGMIDWLHNLTAQFSCTFSAA